MLNYQELNEQIKKLIDIFNESDNKIKFINDLSIFERVISQRLPSNEQFLHDIPLELSS